MFTTSDQFFLSVKLLRGLVALGDKISPTKFAQKQHIAKLLLAELSDPRTLFLDYTSKALYVGEIKMYCPDLFN